MHRYLRAIGFSQINTRTQMQKLISEIVKSAKTRKYARNKENVVYTEYTEEFSEDMGIIIRGVFEEDNKFLFSHFVPFLRSTSISSLEDISVERHAEKESYAGVCDDTRVGVTLIFYLLNTVSYLKIKNADKLPLLGTSLSLTGLSIQGTVMMPIIKNDVEIQTSEKFSINRKQLLEAARKGDEDAIENLTMEDMDTYTTIAKKIQKEDVFSLVDTYFMPYGVECDQYSILGEILSCSEVKNRKTKESVWKMTINCNELKIDICINAFDLVGAPQVGRRFKGVIWMQGFINYPSIAE